MIGNNVLVFLLICGTTGVTIADITSYKRVCYFTSWASDNPGSSKFTIDNVTDPYICTHYIYSFAGVDSEKKTIIPLSDIDEKGGYTRLLSIKKRAPEVKVLLALGGWSFGVEPFAKLANTTESIDEFADNAVNYLRKWGFDGVDVDWEYPTQRGSGPEDRDNFALLLEKLRRRFEADEKETKQPRLLLTSAVPISKWTVEAGYDTYRIGQAVDFLNVMVYDLYGSWSDKIGHHAPLYSRAEEYEAEKQLNVEWGINNWALNVSRDKLVLGMPLYSRTFLLYNSTMNKPGDPKNGTGTPGPFTANQGTLSYFEVCIYIKSGEFQEIWIEEQSVPYAVSKTEWLGYDNERSAKKKANYVKDNQLGGIMVWELSNDDFGGIHCENGKFPMMNTLKRTLLGSREDCAVGSFGHLNTMGCFPCPRNTYQQQKAQLSCLKCPVGQITKTTNSFGEYQCIFDCSSGFEYDHAPRRCVPCPVGYYRLKPNSWFCEKCPSGYTTVSTGSRKCVKVPEGIVAKDTEKVDVNIDIQVVVESCTNKQLLKQVLLKAVKDQVKVLSQTWSGICKDDCENVVLQYVTGCDSRKKRSAHAQNTLHFTIQIKRIPEELTSGGTTRRADSLISEALSKREEFNSLESYMITYEGPTSISSMVVCLEQNYAFQNDVCAPCPKGSYYNVITTQCRLCGYGTYQEMPGTNLCNTCPGILSTQTTGSTMKDACLLPCNINTNYCKNNGKCTSNETSVECKCLTGFEGDKCETKIERPFDKELLVGAVVGCTIAVLLVVFIIIASCACWRYSRRPRRYKEMKSRLRLANKDMFLEHPNMSVMPVARDESGKYYNDYCTLRAFPTLYSTSKKTGSKHSYDLA